MKYSLDKLIEQYNQGERVKYLFFWGHQPSKDGSIGLSCFSQWWDKHPFEVNQVVYQTTEHWMMAKKAELFRDQEICAKILQTRTAAEVKKLGREVKGFNYELWEKNRYEIVKQGNLHKFEQHEELKSFLLTTNTRVIVEASPLDQIWGVGLAAEHPDIENPLAWKGLNLLGFALMEVRDELR